MIVMLVLLGLAGFQVYESRAEF